jgi:DNA polymerase III epsilon subunit-like protein
MKRFGLGFLHLLLIGATSGGWLIFLIPYVIYKKIKQPENRVANSDQISDSSIPFKKFSGNRFAQDSAKGAVFTYASLEKGESYSAPYAIIDLETTGLDKTKNRIIEIAIRRIDNSGKFIDEISTLINPEVSDVGPTFIHHIKPEHVLDAPTFSEFAPEILNRLSGSIVVAHHAAFEDGFLGAEFARIGVGIPSMPAIDTLWLSRQVIDLPNYKMATVIDAFGIKEEDAHTALGDVRMLSKLLPILIAKSKPLKYLVPVFISTSENHSGRIKTRVSNLSKGESGWMANVLKKLPESGLSLTDAVIGKYTEMLNEFLSDGKIIGEEAKALAKIAGSSGLGAEQMRKIHQDYFAAIEKIALEDGVLTEVEKKKLSTLKSQLGL